MNKLTKKFIPVIAVLTKQPPDGNCLNWVAGHLLWAYNYNLPVLNQKPVFEEDALKRYARGTGPLEDEDKAIDFKKLLKMWRDTIKAIHD